MMSEAIDYTALNRVRPELGEQLTQARQRLEEFAQNPGNPLYLQECIDGLHQARGALQLVELDGASRLAAEMDRVLCAMGEQRIEPTAATLELLMQALIQLPDYLSRLSPDRREAPYALLPVINGLRAVCGEGPLTESVLFAPDLTIPVPPACFNSGSHDDLPDVHGLARTYRPRYQAGLVEWYRAGKNSGGLQTVYEVLANLQQASRCESVARLWWFGAGLAEALMRGALAVSSDIRQLFGRIDRQIKRLIDIGESTFSGSIPDDLLRSLLLQILQAETSVGRIGDIREIYAPRESDERAAAESLTGCNQELFSTVAAIACERIEDIKVRLDGCMRTGLSETADLTAIVNDMHTLGNALGMVDLENARRMLAEQERLVRAMLEGEKPVPASGLPGLADVLLAVEAALLEFHAGNDPHARPGSTQDIACRQGLEAVTCESLANMTGARECIDSYIRMPGARAVLADVPPLLHQVRGGLMLAGEERAAALVGQLCACVSQDLIAGTGVPDDQQLSALADAICSIEYYVEELKEGPLFGGMVLDVAEQSLEKLGYSSLPAAAQAPGDQSAVIATPRVVASAETQAPVISALQVIAGDVDTEILDIFLEEAAGEIARVADLIHGTTAGVEDGERLETIRRAFHTLKGSGRMVGAQALGDFAWVFERLIRQVMDGEAGSGEKQLELLEQVTDPLRQLLEQIRGGAAPQIDIDGLVVQAVNLLAPVPSASARSSGEAVAIASPAHAGEALDEEQAAAAERGGIGDAITSEVNATAADGLPVLREDADPELVGIFMEEAAEELSKISANLPEWLVNPGNREALETVRRSFHTLKGSGRMAGAMIVGEFASAFEVLLNRVIDGSCEADAELRAFLDPAPALLSGLLGQVAGGPAPTVDYRTLMDAAERLSRGEGIPLFDSGSVPAETKTLPSDTGGAVTDLDEDRSELLHIFGRECRDHLTAVREFIRNCERVEADCHVTEELDRALHTLTGIAESAQIAFISALAGELYAYFGELDAARQPPGKEAVDVLKDCTAAMSELVDRLPDGSFDTAMLHSLQESIRSLPHVATHDDSPVTQAPSAEIGEEILPEMAGDDPARPVPSKTGPERGAEPATFASVVAVPSGDTDHYAGIDPELFEVFLEEATEIIESSEATLHAWVAEPAQRELMDEFRRQLHTLKGGARMVDIAAIGNLSHSLETLLTRVFEGRVETTEQLFGLLRQAHDRLADMLEKVKAREIPEHAHALEEQLARLGSEDEPCARDAAAGGAVDKPEAEAVMQTRQVPDVEVVQEWPSGAETPDEPETAVPRDTAVEVAAGESRPERSGEGDILSRQPERRKTSRVRSEQVRVQAELLDDLVNYSGEINIYRARVEQQLGVYRFNLAELHQTINRVRDQLRQFEIETETQILHRFEREAEDRNLDFDPLEMDRYSNLQQLSRSLVETISDLHSIQELLDNTTRETESLLLQQSRVITDLQEGLMRVRMIPFAGLAPRLRRIVRQAAGELGKKVELALDGAEGEMDRNVIERIIAPLEHMLRNAVDHGIELPEERREAGKPETGTITIAIHREGPEIVLQVADDGRGISHEAIRARAIERGLIAADAQVSESDVMQFVLQTGFSTAARVTQISGRGVGMDVVNSEVKQLGGSLLIDSASGKGSIFTIRLPYTLAINQALLVRVGEETFCIPLGTIEGVVRVDIAFLVECYESPDAAYRYAGIAYQLHHLGTLLNRGRMDLEAAQGRIPVLLVRIGEKRLALQVDALIGNREIVVKPLGAQLSSVPGVSGATILGDGRVILILDMAAVSRMAVRNRVPFASPDAVARERLLVMVVDDSITVRKVTTRLLDRYGFEVITAKDGVDAVSLLQDRIPDVMLLDIEMPRMDGFELARHVRSDERLQHIPITMITSRTGDKHRERAMQIGVNHYLGKPFQEHELLKTIHRLIGMPMADGQEQTDVFGHA
jgi:chemosensory pili system protein ChpA (sensor histidine kinase/response regulator)